MVDETSSVVLSMCTYEVLSHSDLHLREDARMSGPIERQRERVRERERGIDYVLSPEIVQGLV